MKTLLWLDDMRDPHQYGWLSYSPIKLPYNVVWVKSYQQFVDYITESGLPDAICFDHDLGLDMVHETKQLSKRALKRHRKTPEYKTGMDCAHWLVNYCIDNRRHLPLYNIQSSNPVGKSNIDGLFKSFKKHIIIE